MNTRTTAKSVNKSLQEFEIDEIESSLPPDISMAKYNRKNEPTSKCCVFVNKKLQCLTLYVVLGIFFLQLLILIVEKTNEDVFNELSSKMINQVRQLNNKLNVLPNTDPNETIASFNSSNLFFNVTRIIIDTIKVHDNINENSSDYTTISYNEY